MADNKAITVEVINTEEVIFTGEVDRISSYNEVGAFDIFPMHANFISILGKQLVLYNKHQKIKEIPFEQAVLKVKKDVVTIFLGIEVLLLDDEGLNPETKNPKSSAKK